MLKLGKSWVQWGGLGTLYKGVSSQKTCEEICLSNPQMKKLKFKEIRSKSSINK